MPDEDLATAPQTEPAPKRGKNLLDNKLIGGLFRSRWFPGILQWITVFVFGFIMWQLLLGPDKAHDNFGTALTWVLWWPLIPIIFLLLGRFWCAICPFATVSDWIQKWVGNNRPVPKFLKKYGIWIIDILFIAITWSDHVFGLVESPRGSGVLMLLITTGVVFSGAFWQRRTWCTHLCFLGGLSGNYARTSVLELRATPEKCETCTTASCYKGTEIAPGCPLFEFPRTMDSNANCNVCGYCIKNCPNDSIRVTTRVPTKELWFIRKPKLDQAFLAVVIMGIVFIQNFTMLTLWDSLFESLERLTGTTVFAVNFTIVFIVAMAIPLLLMVAASFFGKLWNRGGLWRNFAIFGYAIIPLDVAGHIAHNLFHLLAEGKTVIFTGKELLTGVEAPAQSAAFVGDQTILIMQLVLIALGTAGSMYTAYRIARSNFGAAGKTWGSYIPFAALILALAAVNVWLFNMPMASRM